MPEEKAENLHRSVLLEEAVELLNVNDGGTFVDATLGMGGHVERMLGLTRSGTVIAMDQDADAIAVARERLRHYGDRLKIFHSNFTEIKNVIHEAGVSSVDGVLADLGVSSLQLDSPERGFSFR